MECLPRNGRSHNNNCHRCRNFDYGKSFHREMSSFLLPVCHFCLHNTHDMNALDFHLLPAILRPIYWSRTFLLAHIFDLQNLIHSFVAHWNTIFWQHRKKNDSNWIKIEKNVFKKRLIYLLCEARFILFVQTVAFFSRPPSKFK